MTRKEITQYLGQFGEIKYNGIYYPSTVHGFIRDINLKQVRIERLEGNDIIIPIASVKSFKKKRTPELVE